MRGRVFALGAGVSFGTLGIFSKLFYEHGGQPFELLVLRFVGTVLLLWGLVGLRRRGSPNRRIVLLATGIGVFQVGANIALLVGFDHAPAGLVVLLFYVYPLLVTLGGALLLGEELGLRRAVVIALGLAGIALTVGAPSSVSALGIALGLAAGVCTASYILGARHLMAGPLEPIEIVALGYTGPALGFLVVAGVRGFDVPSAAGLGYAAGLILVGSFLAMILFYGAVKLVGAGTASLLATVEPLTVVLLAYVVLDESLEATQLGGGALIVSSVVALTLPGRSRRAEPAPVTHP